MWLFAGRFNSQLLWNANVQRTRDPIVDPIAELAGGQIDLSGTENGNRQRYQVAFRRQVSNPEQIATLGSDNIRQLQIVGQLDSRIDGSLLQGDRLAHQTPEGLVLHTVRHTPERSACVIEGTAWPLETPNQYLARYSELVKHGHKSELMSAMRMVLPLIKDIEILTDEGGRSYLSAITDEERRLPLKDLGGGIVRLFRMQLGFFAARGGMAFFDEMENGFHYSVHGAMWDRIRSWMKKWDVQVVATTHSSELVDAAIAAFKGSPNDLSIHHIFVDKRTGKTEVSNFSGETLEGASELNLEIR